MRPTPSASSRSESTPDRRAAPRHVTWPARAAVALTLLLSWLAAPLPAQAIDAGLLPKDSFVGAVDAPDDVDVLLLEALADSTLTFQLKSTKPADLRATLTLIDLADDGVPAMLVHQDLVPENLVWSADRVVFLDWSDTVVGHPFFGLDRLLDFCWSDPEIKAAVIEAYIAGFADFASADRLRRSFDRVLWLRVLYEDLRWHHEILAVPADSEHAGRLRADQLAGLRMVARHQR